MDEEYKKNKMTRFLALIILSFLILVGRLWYLQIVKGEKYASQADGNRIRMMTVAAPRGLIYDRNGKVLATNRFAHTVMAVTGGLTLEENRELAQLLSPIIEKPEEEILDTLSNARPTYPYEPIRLLRDVGTKAAIAIEEHRLNLPGVMLQEEWVREYKYESVAGNVLGYLGLVEPADVRAGYRYTDLIGKDGLEKAYESYLKGQDGKQVVEVNALDRPVQILGIEEPIPGHNLYLTLDIKLQAVAEIALAKQIEALQEEYPALKAGAVVVLQPKTGEILALAGVPGYDPNRWISQAGVYFQELSKDPAKPLLHRALSPYMPGSTFKVVTGVAALDTGAIDPYEIYNCTGYHLYGKKDWTVRSGLLPAGEVDIRMALARSANDFFWEVVSRQQMGGVSKGVDTIAEYARAFGLGSKTGIELNDQPGTVPDTAWKQKRYSQPWYPAETLDVAIGQGFLEVTPLQLALVYSVIANGGKLFSPNLVSKVVDVQGETVVQNTQVWQEVPAAGFIWPVILEGLKEVVQNPRGTAYRALRSPDDQPWGAVATYNPAGKTGSTQIDGHDTHAWFAGFAPADDPEILVVVFLEYGGGGGASAAPVARTIMDYYFYGTLPYPVKILD
jgi:penicillin-binding protein 2